MSTIVEPPVPTPVQTHNEVSILEAIAFVKGQRTKSATTQQQRKKCDLTRLPALIALAIGSIGVICVLYDDSLGDPLAWATFGNSLLFAGMCLLVVGITPRD